MLEDIFYQLICPHDATFPFPTESNLYDFYYLTEAWVLNLMSAIWFIYISVILFSSVVLY